MQDINLNKMSIGEFRTHISDSDLAIDSFRVNQGDSKIGSVFAILRIGDGIKDHAGEGHR